MARPERSFRTPALILQRRDFSESDRLLTLLSPEHGRFKAIAKGARKPTSTKTGHVELFTQADMLINKGRDLDIVSQAVMIAPYLRLREDLARGAYANYVTELMLKFTPENTDDSQSLYHLLNQTFERLCSDDEPRLVIRYYEIQLLNYAGFRPELNHCVMSGDAVLPQDQYFSYEEGGVVSPEYARQSAGVIPMTLPTLKLLRYMQRMPYEVVRQYDSLSTRLHTDVERLLLGYITYLLEFRLESVDFIRRVREL